MKSNQFFALIWIMAAVSEPPLEPDYGWLWMLTEFAVGGYFMWRANKAGEFK